MLEDPLRDEYQLPIEVVSALDLRPGQVIADIGAGSGYFSFRLAQAVGPKGLVFAIDVNPNMIRHLNRKKRDLGFGNVFSVLAEEDDPLLPNDSVDVFFICNTWHHIPDQEKYLRLMRDMLRHGGKVVMIDFRKEELPVGPPLETKIARADLLNHMKSQ
ncbi:MAG: methyltransferase domain-containing protein, partial [Candidatus Bathyarchaeota archaeon]|nr:methyltransferase domain-containing protein [Candidatus Bathyarchaeota archaeon]